MIVIVIVILIVIPVFLLIIVLFLILLSIRLPIFLSLRTVPKKRLFISATSRDLKSYRELASQTLRQRGYDVEDQAIFNLTYHEISVDLKQRIAACDAVICLIGFVFGREPSNRPPDEPRRSYTQWEHYFARELDKPVHLLVADDQTKFDEHEPESDELRQLQLVHRADAIRDQNWRSFGSPDQLRAELAQLRFTWEGLPPDHKPSNLPLASIGSLFKGREAFLQQIHEALGRDDRLGPQRFAAITASASAAAVYGLGGIGKTRAAIEYAHRHADDISALLFVRADSPAGLQQNLASLCAPAVLDLPEKEACETEVQVAAVLRWLQQHPGWLLICDNVDSEDAAQAVEDLRSQLSTAGQVLVTSRLSNWPGAVESLALDVLAKPDAAAFLLERTDKRSRRQADDPEQAQQLAVELGQLALALEQAGAYIAKHKLTFAQYLERWRSKHDLVLTWFDKRLMQYPLSVAITWQTSFDQLTAAGRELLNLLAWFAPDPIPESLLAAGGGPWGDVAPAEGADSSPDPHDVLADLEAYSLVTRATESPTYSIHRLVQDVTRRSLRDDPKSWALGRTLRWLNEPSSVTHRMSAPGQLSTRSHRMSTRLQPTAAFDQIQPPHAGACLLQRADSPPLDYESELRARLTLRTPLELRARLLMRPRATARGYGRDSVVNLIVITILTIFIFLFLISIIVMLLFLIPFWAQVTPLDHDRSPAPVPHPPSAPPRAPVAPRTAACD